jgi:hypothetical protein
MHCGDEKYIKNLVGITPRYRHIWKDDKGYWRNRCESVGFSCLGIVTSGELL